MNLKVLSYATALIALVCIATSCGGKAGGGEGQTLTVVMDMDMPGYASYEGEEFGCLYDILKAYTDDKDMVLRVIPGKSSGECERLLRRGRADVAATVSRSGDAGISVPLYNTSYMVLTNVRNARSIGSQGAGLWQGALNGSRLLITEGFKASSTYGALLDTLPEAKVFVSARNCFELIEELRNGEYDFLICEKTEAHVGQALYQGVESVFEFDEPFGISVTFPSDATYMAADFSRWFIDFSSQPRFAMLMELYFDQGKAVQLTHRVPREEYDEVISPYDKVMREVCEREGYDWRLISAIAYSESRFKANVVSTRGAAGLMQIMPATARQFDVPQEEIFKPEVNIMLATKLLGRIESMLKFPTGISLDDRMRIILACYNCGIGHVLDARRLASKYGANPNDWDDVALFLQRKAYPQYSADAVVRSGTFRGSRETLAFVDGVMGRYDSYCEMVDR